jgi:hypothetical protein
LQQSTAKETAYQPQQCHQHLKPGDDSSQPDTHAAGTVHQHTQLASVHAIALCEMLQLLAAVKRLPAAALLSLLVVQFKHMQCFRFALYDAHACAFVLLK